MRQLIEYIAKELVNNPKEVELSEEFNKDDSVLYKLKVGKEDTGKVIGKYGRTAKALRTLLNAAASKKNKKASLEILD